jgi:hypothetical protein
MSVVRAPSRGLAYSYNSKPIPPGFLENAFAFVFGERPQPRFEDVRKLRNFELSDAHVHHNFVYTNTREGWFFSPHTEETWFRVLRGFGQFLEGSAMDWQIGDLYDMYNGALCPLTGQWFHCANTPCLCYIARRLHGWRYPRQLPGG